MRGGDVRVARRGRSKWSKVVKIVFQYRVRRSQMKTSVYVKGKGIGMVLEIVRMR
jgi:hypothetical protein